VLGGDNATVMVMATRAQMMIEMDNGKDKLS
jgi:hypothetical protein